MRVPSRTSAISFVLAAALAIMNVAAALASEIQVPFPR